MLNRFLFFIVASMISTAPGWAQALTLAQFTDCIAWDGASNTNAPNGIGYGSVCQLEPGIHNVTSQLVIGRSVEIKGTDSDSTDVILRRTSSLGADNLMWGQGGTVSFIHHLTFDGNRTSCTLDWTPVSELNVSSVAMATVQNVNIIRAPWHGLYLGGTASSPSGGASTLSYSQIGMKYGVALPDVTLTGPQTANRITGMWTYNDYTGAWYNSFAYNGTAAINVYQDSLQYIVANQLYMNRYEQPGGTSGGQLYISGGTSYASVANNVIDGNNWTTTGKSPSNTDMLCAPTESGDYTLGIEAFGPGHRFYNNQIQNNLAYGILLRGPLDDGGTVSLDNTIVSGYDPFCAAGMPPSCTFAAHYFDNNGGCWTLYGCYGTAWGAQMQMAALTIIGASGNTANNITLDHIRVKNSARHGVSLHNLTGSPGFTDSQSPPNKIACFSNNGSGGTDHLYTTGSGSNYSTLPSISCP